MRAETEKVTEIIKEAGQIAMQYFGQIRDHHVSTKEDGSIVTVADTEVDRFLRSHLEAAFPEYSVLSEESPNTRETESVWIIDPIDATKNFANGNPHFGISIALVKNGIPLLGIVYGPAENKLYIGEHGGGATLNGQPIHVSNTANIPGSRILLAQSSTPASNVIHMPIITTLAGQNAELFDRRGCACLDICAVADGEYDAYIHQSLQAWDVAGGIAILEAAGGNAHLLNGDIKDLFVKGIAATNTGLCEQILSITKQYV